MKKEEMKRIVLNYINKNDSASYAEIEWLFQQNGYDYRGELLSCSGQCEHVVFWDGWNAEAFDLLKELLQEGAVHREPAGPLRYLLDGAGMAIPIVKQKVQYKTDHWAPVVFAKGPKPEFVTSQVEAKTK